MFLVLFTSELEANSVARHEEEQSKTRERQKENRPTRRKRLLGDLFQGKGIAGIQLFSQNHVGNEINFEIETGSRLELVRVREREREELSCSASRRSNGYSGA